jgi:hypothetical protein
VGQVIFPLALVHAAVRVDEAALACGHVLAPVALIEEATRPILVTFSLSEAFLRPIAQVDRPVIQFHRTPTNQILTCILYLIEQKRPVPFLGLMGRHRAILRHRLTKSRMTYQVVIYRVLLRLEDIVVLGA